jgi:hypothetical protein
MDVVVNDDDIRQVTRNSSKVLWETVTEVGAPGVSSFIHKIKM